MFCLTNRMLGWAAHSNNGWKLGLAVLVYLTLRIGVPLSLGMVSAVALLFNHRLITLIILATFLLILFEFMARESDLFLVEVEEDL